MPKAWPRILLGLLLVAGPGCASDLVVIVNPQVPVQSVSGRKLLEIYSLRQGFWNPEQPIRIMALQRDALSHQQFCERYLNLFSYRLEWLWSRHLYAGLGGLHQRFDSGRELVAAVAATPGAIGYVEREDVNDQVRVLVVD